MDFSILRAAVSCRRRRLSAGERSGRASGCRRGHQRLGYRVSVLPAGADADADADAEVLHRFMGLNIEQLMAGLKQLEEERLLQLATDEGIKICNIRLVLENLSFKLKFGCGLLGCSFLFGKYLKLNSVVVCQVMKSGTTIAYFSATTTWLLFWRITYICLPVWST